MKAVILAAGEGRRLRNKNNIPKPLTSLLGIPLIERVILQAREEGIRDFIVVTGYQADKIESYLKKRERKLGIKLSFVRNGNWKKGNLSSFYAVKAYVRENFILLMADHLFSSGIISELLKMNPERGAILCVTDNFNNSYSIEAETKVVLKGDKIVDISKDLDKFDYIDTGIFLCSPEVFKIIEKPYMDGVEELSEGFRYVAREGRLKGLRLKENHFFININTPFALKMAEKILLDRVNALKSDDGIISKYINRKISKHITKFISKIPLTPNFISLVSFLVAVLAGISFFLSPFLGGILTQFSSILDGVDGEIARLKFMKTTFGEFMDSLLDRYADSFIIISMTFSDFLKNPSYVLLLISFFALIGSFIHMAQKDKYKALTGKSYSLRKEGVLYYIPASRDVRLFIIMLSGIFDQILWGLLIIAVITNLKALLRLLFVRKIVYTKV